MNTAVLNIKIDPKTKQQLKAFAAELGLPVSALINAQIKQILREGKVEFGKTLEPTPYLEEVMRQVDRDLKTGKNITTTNTLEEALEHLDSL